MQIFLNGQYVPEERAMISVFDRGFLYGDGVFETVLIANGNPFRWDQHWERFERGAAFLNIVPPFLSEVLRDFATQLARKNNMPNSLLRLTLSRGIGIRGYSPKGATHPTIVMSLHPALGLAPGQILGWRLIVAPVRLPEQEPLAAFKTCNKLPQIIARAHAEAQEADEALLLGIEDYVVESSSGNLFWLEEQAVCTPPLASGILPGVTRTVVFQICHEMGLAVNEARVRVQDLYQKAGIFISLSSVGLAEGLSLDGPPLARSPLVSELNKRYCELVRAETA